MEEETRRKAIERYLSGESPKSIYDDLKRTKQWFFKWLRNYQSGDPHWYKSKSTAPVHRPFEIDETRRQQIIRFCARTPGVGTLRANWGFSDQMGTEESRDRVPIGSDH
jgi:transposase-like protein